MLHLIDPVLELSDHDLNASASKTFGFHVKSEWMQEMLMVSPRVAPVAFQEEPFFFRSVFILLCYQCEMFNGTNILDSSHKVFTMVPILQK